MEIIRGDTRLRTAIEADPSLRVQNVSEFEERYESLNLTFHSYFEGPSREAGIENARFHKLRYRALCSEKFKGSIVDVGNDKPFLSFYLRMLNPECDIRTVSFEIPQSPYDLYAVDIESEPLPFDIASVDVVLFAEVLEHLWRDPAYALWQMNRVLRNGGELYLTTPNPCELHAITCILWQANPNQRGQIFRSLESGHLHLWSSADLKMLLEANGYRLSLLTSYDAYKYTQHVPAIWELVKSISPYTELMRECLLVRANKVEIFDLPQYPKEIFPDGSGVRLEGAFRSFALNTLMKEGLVSSPDSAAGTEM